MRKAIFEFHPETVQAVEDLRQYFRSPTKAEIVCKAIALLEIVREARAEGGDIVVKDKDGVDHKILM